MGQGLWFVVRAMLPLSYMVFTSGKVRRAADVIPANPCVYFIVGCWGPSKTSGQTEALSFVFLLLLSGLV